jgi:hypothetical protein
MPRRHVWDIDSDHVQVSCDRVYYTYTRGDATPQNIASMVANLQAFIKPHRKQIGYILEVTGGARPPSAEDRARVTNEFNRCGAQLAGVALILGEQGFKAALLRSALTMVFMMSRKGFPVRIFEQIEDAAQWLGPGLDIAPAEIVELSRSARVQLASIRAPSGAQPST